MSDEFGGLSLACNLNAVSRRRARAVHLVNRALQSVGIQVARTGTFLGLPSHNAALSDLERVLRRYMLPGLPGDPRRRHFLAQLDGTEPAEALHIVDRLHRSLTAPGDVCEFGVGPGNTSVLLAHEIRDTNRHLWLFDTFTGLPKPTAEDVLINDISNRGSMGAYEGKLAFPATGVQSKLRQAGFPESRTHIVAGLFGRVMNSALLPQTVCFAYVDFDLYEGVQQALTFLDARLPIGAHIVVDDYGYFSAGAQAAVDEFVARRREAYSLFIPDPEVVGHFAILSRVN